MVVGRDKGKTMKLLTNPLSKSGEIKQLFTKTFTDSEGRSEGTLIGALAHELITDTNPEALYCFVATDKEQIVGCIIFSRLTFERDVNAFLLAPVAVHTNYQGQGIGQGLITFGLNTIKEDGVELAFTYGDPHFYAKVGFRPISEEIVKAPLTLTYPEGWLAQSLAGDQVEPIPGKSSCVEALNKPAYW